MIHIRHMRTLTYLVIAAAMAAAIGLITNNGWAGYALGAIWAACLLAILYLNTDSSGRTGLPTPNGFALAAVLVVALGTIVVKIGDDNPVSYATALIFVGINVFGLKTLDDKAAA